MDLNAVIADLRNQLDDINRVIVAVERMAVSRPKTRIKSQARLQARQRLLGANAAVASFVPKTMAASGS